MRELEKRVAKPEGGEELLIEKARSASAVAASGAVMQHLVEMSRRIGALEERSTGRNRLEQANGWLIVVIRPKGAISWRPA